MSAEASSMKHISGPPPLTVIPTNHPHQHYNFESYAKSKKQIDYLLLRYFFGQKPLIGYDLTDLMIRHFSLQSFEMLTVEDFDQIAEQYVELKEQTDICKSLLLAWKAMSAEFYNISPPKTVNHENTNNSLQTNNNESKPKSFLQNTNNSLQTVNHENTNNSSTYKQKKISANDLQPLINSKSARINEPSLALKLVARNQLINYLKKKPLFNLTDFEKYCKKQQIEIIERYGRRCLDCKPSNLQQIVATINMSFCARDTKSRNNRGYVSHYRSHHKEIYEWMYVNFKSLALSTNK